MKAKQGRNLALVLATILLGTVFSNCAQRTRMELKQSPLVATGSLRGGTSGGNPARTELKFGSYESSFGFGFGFGLGLGLNPLGVETFTICASEIRFRRSGDGVEIVYPYNREISLLPDGTPISEFTLPSGGYDQVQVTIDDTCGTSRSIYVSNALADLTVTVQARMTFTGSFKSDSFGHVLTLDIVNIVSSVAASQTVLQLIQSVSTGTHAIVPSSKGGGVGS